MRKFSQIDTLEVIKQCREIWNPQVTYSTNQLGMAHEAIASMKDSASAIRHIVGRAEEIEDSQNKTQQLNDVISLVNKLLKRVAKVSTIKTDKVYPALMEIITKLTSV